MSDKKNPTDKTEGTLSSVVLKCEHIKYYLTDYKLTISLDKSSAMLFVDRDLARDYATKVENYYSELMNLEVLGFTEEYVNFLEFNSLS
ncbi:hypothetical protein JUJ52_11235 [Virgibacillus sp. AGTR]|uniref:hypothetical protein n=1 Tax=unclassified Virgibacillus TaxID=2620237 RepID=UPI000EF4DD48|nr:MULTISPECIES: hypothetical protein [unclassified Virgibacillus]MCC2250535.1 hypothetical protein [Virgibacillus sp. AGTR]QRZ18316.1 hypothetical protein JUJ52_00700 [Virgibacillus sp. AGTR]